MPADSTLAARSAQTEMSARPASGWIGKLADFTALGNRSHTAVNVSNGSKARTNLEVPPCSPSGGERSGSRLYEQQATNVSCRIVAVAFSRPVAQRDLLRSAMQRR